MFFLLHLNDTAEPGNLLNSDEVFMELFYAEDISIISNNPDKIDEIQNKYPTLLSNRGLKINPDKTETYIISRTNCDKSWKNAKCWAPFLTLQKTSIKRRKSFAIEAVKTLQKAFENKKLWKSTKANVFDT